MKPLRPESRVWQDKMKNCLCADLPILDYQEALDLQVRLVADRNSGRLNIDTILILEHPPVFTLGRRGGLENLIVSRAFIEQSGIRVVQAERGGNITFHGPGQLVIYPIINLKLLRLKVVDFVSGLEEVMLRTVDAWGLKAERNPLNRGIWVGNNKLGSIGIAVRRGISFHGFALNVNLALEPFEWINPCGLENIGVTSLSHELAHEVPVKKVRRVVKEQIESVFGLKLVRTDLEELYSFIG